MRKEEEQDPDLDRVIATISSGDRVNWGAETTRRPDLAPLLDQLRVMESIAAAHRRVSPDDADQELNRWGPLRVLERIGRGGFGDVFRAFDPRLETEVALKLIHPGSGREARILQEARRMARVRHPNVLTVHGADRHEDRAGLWTDLIDGRTLEDLLAANGPLGAEEATRIGLDLCRALAAVHSAGLVHRDVKTLNVTRERGGRIVLMDFGAGSEQRPNGPADLAEDGTPLTMAPEELLGEPATPASDLYSLGALLYRLVTGRFPVEARSYAELKSHQERGEHVRLRDRRSDLPVSFVRVVEHALEASPERRFRSAGEFERSLMGSGRIPMPPVSAPRPPGRRWWTTRWIAAAVVLVAIVSVIIARPWARRPDPTASGEAVPRRAGSATENGAGAAASPQGLEDGGESRQELRREGPSPGGAARAAMPLVASAAMLRERGDREQALSPGDRVRPGDGLFLRFRADVPLHVYILNEDAAGQVYVLFPAPGTDLINPLAAGVLHRLPGSSAGRNVNWQVTSAGGKETVVLIATRETRGAFERELARLPAVSLDRPVAGDETGDGPAGATRGIGGMVAGAPAGESASRPHLADLLRRLAGGSDPSEAWIWQIELENPR